MALWKRGKFYYYEFKIAGERHCKSTGCTDRKEAKLFEEKLYKQLLLESVNQQKSGLPLSKAAKRYYTEKWSTQKDGETSYRRAEIIVEILGDPSLDEIDSSTLSALRRGLMKRPQLNSKTSVNRYNACLKTLLRAAVHEWKILPGMPTIKIPKENHRIRVMSDKEEMLFYGKADPLMKDLMTIALNTGMRQGEILKLEVRDINLDNRLITVWETKGGAPRPIGLNQKVLPVLERLCKERQSGRIFPEADKSSVQYNWRKLKGQLGVEDLTFHDMRHTFATRLLQKGADIVTVSRLLGHSSVEMTMRYLNLAPNKVAFGTDLLG